LALSFLGDLLGICRPCPYGSAV
jgi:hypothetical protein